MRHSEQLERETEETRARVAETLEELRARISPGQVLDQVVDYTRDSGGGEFVRNLGHQVARNPLPVTLMGAGLAWLMVSSVRASGAGSGAAAHDGGGGIGDKVSDAADSAKQSAERIADAVATKSGRAADKAGALAGETKDRARSTGSAAAETARRAQSRLSSAASSAYSGAGRAASAAADTASRVGHGTVSAGKSVIDFCVERPLVLAGIGIAIGAAIGAALPRTETEDRLMGEKSDEAKERARALATEQAEKAKAVGEAALSEAHKEVDRQDLTAEEAVTPEPRPGPSARP